MSIALSIVGIVVLVALMLLGMAFTFGDLDVDDIQGWYFGRHFGKTGKALEDNDFYKALKHFKKMLRSRDCRERLSRELFHANYSEAEHSAKRVWAISENRALFTDKEQEYIAEVEQSVNSESRE